MSVRDTSETFGQLLHGTARAWRQKLDQRLKPMGLSQAKWRTLMHLSLAGDALTQAEIAARLGVERPSVVTYCIGSSGRSGSLAVARRETAVAKWCCSAAARSA